MWQDPVVCTQVICWKSEEHSGLVLMSVLGILMYPAAILSSILWITWKQLIFSVANFQKGFGLQEFIDVI